MYSIEMHSPETYARMFVAAFLITTKIQELLDAHQQNGPTNCSEVTEPLHSNENDPAIRKNAQHG